MTLELTSPAFESHGTIPTKYTGRGADVSPPLHWTDPPEGTRSFALIIDDPDAPGDKSWVHWIAYNIPAGCRDLPEHVAAKPSLPDGTRQGTNDFDQIGYGGPAPPAGRDHHYTFHLYALNAQMNLSPGARKEDLLGHMNQHILDEAELVGLYAVER